MLHKKTIRMYGKRNETLRELGYGSYAEYTWSSHWRSVRERAFQSKVLGGKNYKCHVCNSKEVLHLHHKSYKSLGRENLNHLVWLCQRHHKQVHKINNKKGVGLWGLQRSLRKKYAKRDVQTRESQH